MSEKQKTLAGIVAEKRELAQAIRKSLSVVPDRRDSQIAEAEELESDADRIEAAWERESKAIATENAVLPAVCITNRGNGDVAVKRERESITPKPYPDWKAICAKCHDGEIEPDCEYYGEPNGCNSPIYGEHPTTEKSSAVGDTAAMREALEAVAELLCEIQGLGRSPTSNKAYAVKRKVYAALAASPRNCDVGTAQEQEVRFERFCHAHRSRERCCEDCPIVADSASCEFTWAQMPYEEGGKR